MRIIFASGKMAASTASKVNAAIKTKPNQNELRRLMKEKQEKKIDSPLAKYNNLGQLFCVLCNTQVKNAIVWTAHINGKAHKQNLEAVKRQKQAVLDKAAFKIPPTPPASNKRKLDTEPPATQEKKIKTSSTSTVSCTSKGLPSDFFDELSSTSDESQHTISDKNDNAKAPELPSGFFEKITEDQTENEPHASNQPKSNSVEGLPEGFFDDPVIDAKVRKVEYKDPVEEEWEKFQREIADATHKAQEIIDEEEEESTVERQIDEIDEQINNWARVDALQRRKAELDVQQKSSNQKNDDDMDVDEQEFEEFLDWRSKGSWR